MKKGPSSVTLMELIICLVLMAIIVVGLAQVYVFSRFHTLTTERRVKLQNEASIAIEHMSKNIARAIGDFNNPAVVAYSDDKGIRIKIDSNGNGLRDDDVTETDLWIAYRHENIGSPVSDSEIRYYANAGAGAVPAGSYESVARHLAITDPADLPEYWGLAVTINPDAGGHLLENSFEVQINACWDPAAADLSVNPNGTSENPCIRMKGRIKMPSVSTN